tara:strand:- start:188 stop:790 length:603 start_codon:yes stop_codon:yes gene_type:complete
MKQQVKLSAIKSNKDNPRLIKDHKFKQLVKSIKEFPEMLKLRPIVVDEDMVVLGGNMRLKASKEAGLKEVWIEIAEGLTEEQKREFVVKDNVSFGEWDWAMLGNEWDSTGLTDWGLNVWENVDDNINKINKGDENSEWVGMPEFEANENSLKIIVHFENELDREVFAKEHKLEFTKKLANAWATHYPYEGRKDLSSLKYD